MKRIAPVFLWIGVMAYCAWSIGEERTSRLQLRQDDGSKVDWVVRAVDDGRVIERVAPR